MKKRLAAWALLACALLTLTGCGEEFRNYRPIEDVNALDGRKIGVNLAWASDYVLSPREGEDLVLYRYDDPASMLMALFYHQIDALCCDAFGWLTLEYTNGEHLHRVEEPIATDGFMNFVTPAREDLRDKFNEFLVYYHETEEFADLYERMTNFDGVHYVPGAITIPTETEKRSVSPSPRSISRTAMSKRTARSAAMILRSSAPSPTTAITTWSWLQRPTRIWITAF